MACPAAVFTVLRRHWEPDPGRPGWAAPLGPSRVHTHFPDTEHGQPPASLVQLPRHPPMEGPASCRQAPWVAAECTRAKESRTEPGKEGTKAEKKGHPPFRQINASLPSEGALHPLSRRLYPTGLLTDKPLHTLSHLD